MSNFANRTEHPVIFTMPVLGWKVIDTLQGPCFEFGDGSHDWPSPRERQIIDAYQAHIKELSKSYPSEPFPLEHEPLNSQR